MQRMSKIKSEASGKQDAFQEMFEDHSAPAGGLMPTVPDVVFYILFCLVAAAIYIIYQNLSGAADAMEGKAREARRAFEVTIDENKPLVNSVKPLVKAGLSGDMSASIDTEKRDNFVDKIAAVKPKTWKKSFWSALNFFGNKDESSARGSINTDEFRASDPFKKANNAAGSAASRPALKSPPKMSLGRF